MRVVVAYPGNFMHAQQAARAFHERDALAAFVTGMAFDDGSLAMRLSACLPRRVGERVNRELRRRSITQVPRQVVVSHPWFEALRTALSRYAKNPIYADMVWDAWTHRFDRTVARQHLDGVDVVHGFEYTARHSFEEARRRGIATILAMPSCDSKEFEEIKAREECRFPELRSPHQHYFAERFARRYERRCAEIALADVIIANSEVTRQSHIRAGADPAKIVAVPLAPPPPIAAIRQPPNDRNRPLSVIWAGALTLGKGGHYFLDAWRNLAAGEHAQARIYGRIGLPDRLLRAAQPGLQPMGSVPQAELFEAFERADILVFPTLADGFGMVVAEALSRGLPVITTDRAGASDLIEHGRNGLVIPASDTQSLTDALRWCLDNREALYRMRFRALETAGRWQWPDYRRQLIAAVSEGLRRVGYVPDFRPEDPQTIGPTWEAGLASAS